ncbi:MAG: tRNA-dihydrouridine synthase, partial [Nanoarchaeota archaeon]|nr:tRNA-dihydrouridine synthase [Nanoarchaeota archaeon]
MKFFGKEISGPFTIPSGITATNINVLNRIAHDIPQVGVLTTKSIGPKFRLGNREPVITQYKPGCFMNAIGLTNPGADEFAKQLSKIKIPENKFLLTSIFGANAEEFVEVAKKLAPYSDGLELNLSCPHAKGYGMAIGQDPKLVKEIVAAVKAVVDIPVIPKLTPNTDKIKEIAKAAVEGGANGICAINTVGPGEFEVEGHPVLTNIKGGMSGKEILSKGLECIKNIASVVDVPIIGCGGISSADDVRLYQEAGAIVFGIGTALHGMHTTEVEEFFKVLEKDLESSTNESSKLVKQVDMSFKKFTLKENRKSATNFSVLVFDKSYDIKPGQFVFAW